MSLVCTSRIVISLLLSAALAACAFDSPVLHREITTIPSRDVMIPAIITMPARKGDERLPLVVMAHGNGGSKHEGGGYDAVADELAARGIASIRMDFPGCGDSTEPFTENHLTNMLADIRASKDFALDHEFFDRDRVGILGFSMGGRLAMLSVGSDDGYKMMALWAPAAAINLDTQVRLFGSEEAYFDAKAIAMSDGFVPFTTRWGQEQELSAQWFRDMETRDPQAAVRNFDGPVMVLYGNEDDIVVPEVSKAAIAAASSSTDLLVHVIGDAGHSLGFYGNRKDHAAEVVTVTVDYFAERL